ncbi:transglycosylase SLT domain-containing protein [Loktanella sp. R86503]|uniref:transglycosylase SLT domain-containing protein n=1 Tax=Loktanella sp. R86503 TaxID=3093847 RepID=UPI0036D956D8
MRLKAIILGGVIAVLSATSVVAELPIRPHSRLDAEAARAAAEIARRTSFRPVARPAHMIRYPVTVIQGAPSVRPQARPDFVPRTRWGKGAQANAWARATMSAVAAQGLDSVVPRDIEAWCPAYAENSPTLRRAFWVGMMSALSKHESTYNPQAVGGGGLWYGLLQILPATARGYGCRATTGAGLQNPIDNLSCAARIMGRTVKRDRAVALHDGRWRGVAADWGPMSNRAKVAEMSAWTRKQDYCVIRERPRPVLRPATLMAERANVTVSTMGDGSSE